MTMREVFRDCGSCGCGCPAVFRTDDGGLVIQGYALAAADKAPLGVPDGEDAVFIPPEVAARMMDALQRNNG